MNNLLALGLGLILLNLTACNGASSPLKVGFYEGKCGTKNVESIIRAVVQKRFGNDRSIVAALLRMQFHDCFVKGCDASLLLNGPSSEKTAPPNLSVRGFDLIDQAKTAVEEACPGVVSCADIIAIATRDAVSMSGFNTGYSVETGRRDGLESLATNVDLPGPTISVSQSINAFARKGLSPDDMVLLLGGGHTVGIAHCSFFQDRIYNFNNTGRPDPSMNFFLRLTLRSICPQNTNSNNEANLDQTFGSSLVVDNGFYRQIKYFNNGILQIDQAIALDISTRDKVSSLAANNFKFSSEFGATMVKLGRVGVLKGTDGEIRKTCGAVNPKPTTNGLISSLIKN